MESSVNLIQHSNSNSDSNNNNNNEIDEICSTDSVPITITSSSPAIIITPQLPETYTYSPSFAWLLCSALSYIFGAFFFFIGSALFYPQYVNFAGITDLGPFLAECFFLLGSLCFVQGTAQDLLYLIQSNGLPILIQQWKINYKNHANLSKIQIVPVHQNCKRIKEKNLSSHTTNLQVFLAFLSIIRARKLIIPMVNATFYLLASLIFTLGAIFFFPQFAEMSPVLGPLGFIIGCALFLIAGISDSIRLLANYSISVPLLTHPPSRHSDSDEKSQIYGSYPSHPTLSPVLSDMRVKKHFNLRYHGQLLVPIGNSIGSILFIIGSLMYLPQYIEEYMILATHCFLVGSVSFTMASSVYSYYLFHPVKNE